MTSIGFLKPHQFLRLIRSDAQNVSRDPIMMLMIGLGFLAPILLVFFRENMDYWAAETLAIPDLSRYVAVLAVVAPAVMIGWVAGFLLLEDRDDGPLLAMETTPVGKIGFIAYRLFVAAILTASISLIASMMVLDITWPIRLCFSVLVGLDGAIVALILLALARNKVEGLALSKLINIGLLIPLLAIIPSALRYVGGIFPTYWLGEMFVWSDAAPAGLILSLLIGLAVHVIWLVGMARLTARRLG